MFSFEVVVGVKDEINDWTLVTDQPFVKSRIVLSFFQKKKKQTKLKCFFFFALGVHIYLTVQVYTFLENVRPQALSDSFIYLRKDSPMIFSGLQPDSFSRDNLWPLKRLTALLYTSLIQWDSLHCVVKVHQQRYRNIRSFWYKKMLVRNKPLGKTTRMTIISKRQTSNIYVHKVMFHIIAVHIFFLLSFI